MVLWIFKKNKDLFLKRSIIKKKKEVLWQYLPTECYDFSDWIQNNLGGVVKGIDEA